MANLLGDSSVDVVCGGVLGMLVESCVVVGLDLGELGDDGSSLSKASLLSPR